jgi:hypothetical protein
LGRVGQRTYPHPRGVGNSAEGKELEYTELGIVYGKLDVRKGKELGEEVAGVVLRDSRGEVTLAAKWVKTIRTQSDDNTSKCSRNVY